MTSPTPEDAVRVARVAVAENRGVGPAVTAGVVQHLDALQLEVERLQAIVDGDATLRTLESYRLAYDDAAADFARTPRLPAVAPPRQAPIRAQKVLKYLRDNAPAQRFRTRLETDQPGQPATGPFAIPASWLQSVIKPQPVDTDVPPPAPTKAVR